MSDALAPIVEMIESDLLSRFTQAAPKERHAIHVTARLAAQIARVTNSISEEGCNTEQARLHASCTESLANGLVALGTDRVHRSLAEHILADALMIRDELAALCAVPPGGTA